jgi:hypothetical protein
MRNVTRSLMRGNKILSTRFAWLETPPWVREEVAIGKKPIQEVRDLTGEVRREELVVLDAAKRTA